MTLWNLMTILSRPSGAGPRAGFDPSWTGDPVAPHPADPQIGIGETHAGGASVTAPRRHPIGFAPPQEHDAPVEFRTEISFKRHHEAPRASAVADDRHGQGDLPAWQTPVVAEPVVVEPVVVEQPVPEQPVVEQPVVEQPVVEPVVADGPAAEDPPVELPQAEAEVVPFYKREITFRRKKETPVDPVAAEATEPEAVEEHTAEPEQAAEQPETGEKPVPFYKRDISLRRKPAAQADDGSADEAPAAPEVVEAPPVEAEVAAEETAAPAQADAEPADQGDESVPFYRREISFRRKKEDEPVAAGAETEVEPQAAPEPEVEHVAAAEPVVAEPVAVEPLTVEPAAVEPVAVDPVTEESPVAEAELEHALEPALLAAPVVVASLPAAEAETAAEATPADAPAEPVVALPAAEEPVAEEPVSDEPVAEEPAADQKPRRFGGRKQPAPKKRRHRTHAGKSGKVVGLKIGASQIAAAVVAHADDGNQLLELARRPLEAGIVVDGEVRDEAALASAVKAFFDEHRLPRTDVRIGLSSNRIGVRTIDMPAIGDHARFDNAVRFKAHEVLPVALDESVLDYRVLAERQNEDGELMRRVLLVVAPRDQVEPFVRVADQAGIRLAGADLEALALLRAFVEPGTVADPDDTATVVVGIGHESSTLLVSGGGACEFTRVFDWGGGTLADAIATTLEVRPVEATTILRHLSLTGPGRQYDPLDETARLRATDAVRQRLTPFARELVNSLQFYQTQADSLGIGRILITGGTSHLEGLDAALNQMIGVDVSVGDPFARVERAAEFDPAIEASIGSLAVPIGLAIRDDASRAVDLLPRGAVKRRRSARSTALAVGAPVAVAVPIAALALLYVGAHGKVSDQQSQLDALQSQISALPKPKEPVIDTAVVGDEAARATAVANLLGGRVAWDGVFRDFARVLPDNVWLTSLTFAEPDASTASPTPAPTPGGATPLPSAVSVEGYTYSQPDVARLLARLATLPSLSRVTLTKSEVVTLGSKKVVHFVLVADLSSTGGAS